MRDGLHHGAPVGRRWRRAIRDISERADFADVGCRRMAAALVAELRADLRPTFLDALRAEVGRESGRLFPTERSFADRSPPAGLRGDMSDAEQAVAAYARRGIGVGSDPDAVVQAALGAALRERLENNRRQVIAHVMKKAPRDLAGFRSRWGEAEAGLDAAALARSMLDGNARSVTRVSESPVDLDADLLGAN